MLRSGEVDLEHLLRHGFWHRAGLLLMLAGMSVLTLPLVLHVQAVHSQNVLEYQWENAPAETRGRGDAATWRDQPGGPLTKLVIPKIGLEAVVVEGTTPELLAKGPGRFPDSAMPSEAGNCCIAGHRNVYGSWFRRLDRLAVGDTVLLRRCDTEFTYQVTDVFTTSPDNLYVLEQTSEPTLTLITCTPAPRPTRRLIVVSRIGR